MTLTPLSTSQVLIAWTNIANDASYILVLRSLDGTNFTQVAFLPPSATSYNDLGLQPSTLYFYQVVAHNAGGAGAAPSDAVLTLDLTWNGPITGGPGVRAHHSAIYDSAGQRMIMFGGANPALQGDLWQLNLSNAAQIQSTDWSPLAATGTPPGPRAGHSAIYDSVNNRMIVFGGQQAGAGASAYLNELWVLTLGASPAWSMVTVPGAPEARRSHSAIYDPARHEMIIYGGFDSTGLPFSNFYVLSITASTAQFTWSSPTVPLPEPLARQWHAAIHDPLSGRMVLFGGLDNDTTADGTPLSGETWTLTPGSFYSWTQMSFPLTPSPVQGHSLVYDSLNQRMLLFAGGDASLTPLAPPPFWTMNLSGQASWMTLTPGNPGPAKIQYHSAIYDDLNHRMVIYGGETSTAVDTAEVWWMSP
jgi:hypothetical protein